MAVDFVLSGGGATTGGATADRWTDLAGYTESLRNVLARPGTFGDLFPETTDDGLIGLLADGLAECHLETTLSTFEADANGLVRPVMATGQIALVILYAGIRLIRGELLNRATSTKYVAGPVSAESTQSTNILRDVMKALEEQKIRITLLYASAGAGAFFSMDDAYMANAFQVPPNGVRLADWLPAQIQWYGYSRRW